MNKKEQNIAAWQKKYPYGKASLAWNLADYLVFNDEPPKCVFDGQTEGELMNKDEALAWAAETIKCLRVLNEEFPNRFGEQKRIFELDLEYLQSLGKITTEEKEDILKPENYIFEEPE